MIERLSTSSTWKRLCRAALAAAVTAADPTPAAAQLMTTGGGSGGHHPPDITEARIIEWDIPSEMDFQPGGMMVDLRGTEGGNVWFVTRLLPAVYRFDIKPGAKHQNAVWTSWHLDPANSGTSGGVRKIKTSNDKRYVFVRTAVSLQRVDTQTCDSLDSSPTTCELTTWLDSMADAQGVSDVAVDDHHNVFTAIAVDPFDPVTSVLQRLNPSATSLNVTRWMVGGGAGWCNGQLNGFPCVSGIDVHPRHRHLIYYSEPFGQDGGGNIAELDTYYNSVRRWRMSDLGAQVGEAIFEPRQLHIDNNQTVWVVTGSGHLVSLDPKNNRMTKHLMPEGAINDPWGLAPDNRRVGYTVPEITKNVIGLLKPDGDSVCVNPVSAPVEREDLTIPKMVGQAERTSGVQPPVEKVVPARVTHTDDGTFIEAFIGAPANDSEMPLGITPDQGSRVGTFFYAVGTTSNFFVNRIGRIRFPRHDFNDNDDDHPGKKRHERDDDDGDDDGKRHDEDDDDDDDGTPDDLDGDSDNDGLPDVLDDDDDDDGIENEWDSKHGKEAKSKYVDEDETPGGQHSEQSVTLAPGTLLLVAIAQASDPLVPVSIEIVDAAGQVVATSPQTPGAAVLTWVPTAAGDYTARVKNNGSVPVRLSTSLITREAWLF
jgi:hypothetical protein